MGCSRPGALGVLSSLGLFLPYWSKLSISDSESSVQLELTFGIWGSCLTAQAAAPQNRSLTNETPRHGTAAEKPVTNFTCASYFDTHVVGLKCTEFAGVTSGEYACERIENDLGKSLCASTSPLSLLLVDPSSINDRTKREWLGIVKNACTGYGRASIAVACVTAAFTGLAFVLLASGITCGPIESCIVRAGSLTALATGFLESLLGVFWLLEAKPATNAVFGTSYYMNMISVALFVITFVAARSHTQLGQEAQKMLELDFAADSEATKPQRNGGNAAKNAVGLAPKNILVSAV